MEHWRRVSVVERLPAPPGLIIGAGQSIKIAIKGTVNTVITGAAVTSTPSRSYDTYGAGEKIRFTVTFNGPVDVTGSPKLPIVVLTKIRYATYESGSGSAALVFAYTVREGEWDNNGVLAPPTHRRTSIKLTGGDAIRTSGTNEDAILSTIDISGPSHRVKTDPAWTGDIFVSNLGKTSESTSAAATTGSRMAIAQRFTTRGAGTLRAVRIDGSFSTNSSATNVSIFSADGALGTPGSNLGVLQNPGTLHSTAQVHEFRAAAAGVALAANTTYYVRVAAVQGAVKRTTDNGEDGAWGWTLADAYHAQASSSWSTQTGALKLALLGTSSAAPPAAPRVSGKPVVATPGRDCAWTPGEAVEVTLAFSEEVTVDTASGTPTLKLQLGFQDDRTATYLSGSGTTELLFSYAITAADGRNLSMNVLQNGLRLNGATIQSTETGADARIAHDHGNYGARPKGKCAVPEGRGFLVGNLAMSDYLGASLSEIDSGFAQSFRPGGERTLRRVVLHGRFSTTSQVSIYSDSSGLPGTSLATLVNPTGLASTLSDLDNHTFSAEGAGGVALSAGTTYWVVLEGAGHVRVTTETGEDGLSGWSIGDNGAFRSTGESSWNPAPSRVFRMALYGVLPPADPPTVVGAPFIPRHPPCYECAGIWKPGRSVEVRLTFSEPVTVKYRRHYRNKASEDTKPTLDIQMGGLLPTRTATYWRGSGTRTLVFGYWVAAADGAHNSVSVAPNSLALNDGEIYSPSSGLAADLAHEGVGEIRKTFVSNLGETAEAGTVSVSSSITAYAQPFTTGTGGTLRAVRITGAFNSTSQVSIYSDSSGSPGSSVKTLSTPGNAADLVSTQEFDAGSDGLALTASTTYWIVVEGYGLLKFTAQSGESGESGWSLGDSYWGLSGGSWAEASPARAIQVAVLGVAGGGAPAQVVDPPTVSGTPAVSAAGSDGAWTPDETVEVTLTFSEAVTVDTAAGTPSVGVSLGGTDARSAAYASGSGTAELVFGYTLVATDGSHTSMAVAPNSLALNGGTIRSQAHGIDADLTNPGTLVLGTRGGEQGAPAGFTARFESLPERHDGETAFTFELHFSEAPVGLSYRTVQGALLDVSGANITHARRLTQGSNLGWEITAEPTHGGDIVIALPVRTCDAANAVCANGATLAQAVSATVRAKAFAAAFENPPAEHDGTNRFEVRFHLSEEPAEVSYVTVRDSLFAVTGGSIANASRLVANKNRSWKLTVQPAGKADVTLTVKATTACDTPPGICTSDGRMLAGGLQVSIAGPAALSVADAEVDEAVDATLDFVVTLSKKRFSATTVDYATSDGTATAGSDYAATSGTLTFAALETTKTVSVPVLDDAHDEGSETMTLTLSNPTPSSYVHLDDGEATGTIKNTDAMPKAWIARFGRTVAEQVLDAVEGRLEAPRAAGVEASVAGQRLGGAGPSDEASDEALERREAEDAMTALADWLQGETAAEEGSQGFETRAVTERDILLGSSFALTGGSAESGFGALWGRASVSGFDGRDGDLTVDGEVTSAMVGADWTRGPATAGLTVAHSRGDGSYRSPGGDGEAESTLTGVYPYGRYAISERVSVWGVAGYGTGSLTLKPGNGTRIETDLALAMGALGLRGVLVEAPAEGGMELSVKSDGMMVRTSSDAARGEDGGNMAAAEADVTRLRLGLQATWHGMGTGGGGILTPSVEIGVRRDGGDAETGYGADIGAGLTWIDPGSGISADIRARALLAHEADGFSERGFSGTVSWDPEPSTALGPTLTLSQTVGAASSGGADALLGRRHLEGLTPGDGGDELERRHLEAKLGYGFALFGGRYAGTPEIGLGLSDAGREMSLGWRLAEARPAGLAFGLDVEGARREQAYGDGGPEHRLGLGLGWRLEGAGAGSFEVRFEGARLDAANDDAEHRLGVRMTVGW